MRILHKYFIVGLVVLIAAILVGVFFWWNGASGKSAYTAVFLKTGDLYFGKLQRFPSYGLKQPYLLQINKDNPQNPVSLQSFKNVIWGPEDFININREEVVWTANIRSDSNLAKILDTNPDLSASQSQVPQPQAAQPATTSAPTQPKK